MENDQRGLYTVDFSINECDQEISVFGVKAMNGQDAEKIARFALSPQYTYTCTGTDRVRDV